MTKSNKTIFTCKRRCWACKSYSSCSLRGIRRSNAVAFIFLVVSSSKYAILQELNCDYGSYTRLCSVELYYSTMTSRWDHGFDEDSRIWIAQAFPMCHGNVDIWKASLRASTSVSPEQAKNDRWHRWLHEAKTKMTPFDKMPSRWSYEGQNGHTYSTRKWTFARSFGNLLTCQRFCYPTFMLASHCPEIDHRWTHDKGNFQIRLWS
jgi:hypothetical protein